MEALHASNLRSGRISEGTAFLKLFSLVFQLQEYALDACCMQLKRRRHYTFLASSATYVRHVYSARRCAYMTSKHKRHAPRVAEGRGNRFSGRLRTF